MEDPVRNTLMFIAAALFSASGLAVIAAQQSATAKPAATAAKPAPGAASTAKPAPAAATTKPNVDEALRALRADLQGERSDIIAKNLTLTAEQAAKFWPVYDKYQKEQNAIMDEQLAGIQKFVDNYQNMDDATALTLLNAHLDRDAKMVALRVKWLPEFQKVLPTRTAARLIQIDRRLSMAHQLEFSARLPLIH